MKVITLSWIRERARNEEYFYSKHADVERQNDGLLLHEIEEALLNGIVLEQYEDTGRGESCLVVGFSSEGKPIHVVCGRRGDQMAIVTVYIPRPPKYKNPYERG